LKHLAIDIGAESGRGIVGEIIHGELKIHEVARFENRAIHFNGALRWNLDHLVWSVRGIVQENSDCRSVGVDTWAVDTVLLDNSGLPLFQPFHYRDSRTSGVMEKVLQQIPRQSLFEQTGAQFLPFNTLYQWVALVEDSETDLSAVDSMVMIPDFLHMSLSGAAPFIEWTNSTTTQFMNPRTKLWCEEVLTQLNLPVKWLPPVCEPGKMAGTFNGVEVVVPASHDTASAILAVPDEECDSAWISSGTWSIIGVDLPVPVLSAECLASGFANEGSPTGFRLSKNVAGLWIIQQCREYWSKQGTRLSYEDLSILALESNPTQSLIDPDDPCFLSPGEMPNRIREYLIRTEQEHQLDKGQIVKVVLESLAAKYRFNLDQLRKISSKPIRRIHVVGGGSQHPLLNQLTADYCQIPIIAGPVEATSVGNLMMQMIACGSMDSFNVGRALVKRSFELKSYSPSDSVAIQAKYDKFLSLINP
jgi:rhamnulokinase